MLTGAQIKALRKRKKYTQQELADIVGVSRSAVYFWEKGTYPPDEKNAVPLAAALGIGVTELLPAFPNSTATVQRVGRIERYRYFEELPDGSLVPVRHPAHHCALDEVLAENPDLEVWFRTQKLSEEAKEEIARLLLAIKNKWSAESASEAGDDLPALSLRAASSHACDKTDEEDEEDEDLHFRTR